jgi:hypothetical protein
MVGTKKRQSTKALETAHRGRIQAQGGGVEMSVSWSRQTPLTESEMMAMVEVLESKLTSAERGARVTAFEQVRRLIRNASATGGLPQLSLSFLHLSHRGIRVDLEVLKGNAAVPASKRR